MSRDPRYYEPDPIKAPRAADSAAPTPAPAPPGAAEARARPGSRGAPQEVRHQLGWPPDTDPPTADAPPRLPAAAQFFFQSP
ncbi:eukaryotic translation initiation factor 3 subunit F-like isoform X1 [Corvus moneduloides]|uniref:eukaryotic translation initiation factor 3 subunit F-like isoform X1 n=1 Tax=Corvus moneduloides TaxID=1196302 RepID=UPI001363246E|nr:eukaryotic translation initiation factor 3 subunit F-like isoform X1 [Corvus moneduloides]